VAAGTDSQTGHCKQALFFTNMDAVAAFLGESKRRGTIRTLFGRGGH